VALLFTPAVVPVTFTVTVHEVLAPTVPAVRDTVLEPATALGVPLQVLTSPFGVATTRPGGRLSLKASPVKPIVFGLVIVIVKLVEPFNGIVAAPNAFAMVGGEATVIEALAVLPVPPFVDVT
jgi:hypothetical protein